MLTQIRSREATSILTPGDVHAGTKQMDRASVPQAMRADPFCGERRQAPACLCDSATNQAVNSETSQRLTESVEEDEILCSTASHEWFESVRGA
jgi:hypothetical protein